MRSSCSDNPRRQTTAPAALSGLPLSWVVPHIDVRVRRVSPRKKSAEFTIPEPGPIECVLRSRAEPGSHRLILRRLAHNFVNQFNLLLNIEFAAYTLGKLVHAI